MYPKRRQALLLALSLVLLPGLSGCVTLLPTLPKLSLAANQTLGAVPLEVAFDTELILSDQAKTDPTWTYTWDFGDGTAGQGPEATHTYATPGTYRVELTLSDGEDFSTQRSVMVTALAAPRFEVQRFATGLHPLAGAVVDLNLDGRPDLLSANAKSHSISVFLSTNDAFTANPYGYPAIKAPSDAPQPQNVTLGDINGDTLFDLIVLNEPDDNLTVLFGNGIGGFETPSGYRIVRPSRAVTGDFSGNRQQDVLVVSNTGNNSRLVLMQGKGTGELKLGRTLLERSQINGLVAADFNHDGKLDIAVSTKGFGVDLLVLLNEGKGTFAAPVEILLPAKPSAMALSDFNFDGNKDLITANNDGTVSLIAGDGQGGFELVDTVETQLDAPSAIVSADVNGDHRQDVLLQYDHDGTSDLAALLGDGHGAFSAPVLLEGVQGAVSPVTAYIDDDLLEDVMLVSPATNELILALNRSGSAR